MAISSLQLAAYDGAGGALLADWSAWAEDVEFSTAEHGFRSCSFSVPLRFETAVRYYARMTAHLVITSSAGRTIWEGRIEDVTLLDGAIQVVAFGYWNALYDQPYTALWSENRISAWVAAEGSRVNSNTNYVPSLFDLSTTGGLRVGFRQGVTYNTNVKGAWVFLIGGGPTRPLSLLQISYQAQLNALSGGAVATVGVSSISSAGVFTTATLTTSPTTSGATGQVVTLAADTVAVCLELFISSVAALTPSAANSWYVVFSAVRITSAPILSAGVFSPITVDRVAADVLAVAPQLSTNTSLISAASIDQSILAYNDAYPADVINALISLSDGGQAWEAGVAEGRMLYFRVRGSAGRTWLVDACDLTINRTVSTLRTSAYSVYSDTNGLTQRTAVSTDAASFAKYGLTRRLAVAPSTSSSTQATSARDSALTDAATPVPRASLTVDRIYNEIGSEMPLWYVRAGDRLTIRSLSPVLPGDVDRLRSFEIIETTYDMESGRLTIVPSALLPDVDVLLAQR